MGSGGRGGGEDKKGESNDGPEIRKLELNDSPEFPDGGIAWDNTQLPVGVESARWESVIGTELNVSITRDKIKSSPRAWAL